MAGNKDFIDIIREIRGSATPGQPLTDGIWYELTVANKNGNPGIYGDILAKYGIVTESAGTFDQAVAILENLNVEVTTLPAGSSATSALVNGIWQIGIPRGINGIDGNDGSTPELTITYDLGNIKYTVTVDGVVVTNTNILNLDTLVDSKVSTNVGVQETLEAKQEVLDAVATAQGISDSLDASVITKKQEIATYTSAKIGEISTQVELEKTELDTHATVKVNEYNANALNKLNQYNDNHTNKLNTYNSNDSVKLTQYNENHIERLNEINYAYADRIIEMIKTRNFMGIMDEYVAQTDTHMITFLDTTDVNYIYYANGTLLVENVDYTVYDSKTIELTVKANPYDVIVQVNTQILNDMLTAEGGLFEDRLGQPNGVASLNEIGQIPSEQLPSYVDDVIEVQTKTELPIEGEANKIYVVVNDESSNGDTTTYRWTGTIYAVVSNTLNASDVKALYEANANTNAYTDSEKSRVDINIDLTTTAQTLPTAINELDNRVANIEDNTTLAEYGITDAYTKTEVQETLPAVGLDTTNTVAPTRPGQIKWNQNEGTLDLALNNGVTLQLGQENTRLVRNATLSAIPDMTVCMFDGTIGNSGRIKVAPFTGLFNQAHYIYGIATQSINAGEDGYVTIDGKVRNVNTTGSMVGEVWVDGDILYAKPNDAGRLTKVVPTYGQLKMPVANVVHAHTNGTLEVRVTPIDENAYEPSNSNIQGHIIDTSNPHGVTKAQVGLGNVDNTSDLNKIISTATQTALDLKANRIDVDDLFTDASNLGYDDTFTDMRVADVQAALAHLGEESKYWSNIHSAVRLFGGIIQDNGDGTVRVANGGGLFKKEASSVEGVPAGECEPMQLNAAQGGKLFYETWEAAENVQLTNNAYNYIFIVWDHTFDNGDGSFGKARVIASTNFYLQDWESEISYYNFKAAHPELTLPARRSGMLHGFTVGRVYKMDNEITIRVCGTNGWNFNKRVQLFGEEFFPVIRARGLDIQTIPNTLQFNVTEGVMWAEMANRFTVRAFEMDKGDTFTSWYQHTAETTALTLAQIQSTYPTGIANRKYDILYSSTDTKYYRLNPSNNTWGEVLDYINSKVSISTHPANLSELETLAPTGYVNNSQGTDYVVLQLQATDSFYRYNPNAALGNRWELFGDKSTVHPYVVVAFLGDVAGMNAQYPTGFNDVINVIVGCADGMYYEYSGVSGQSGWKRVHGYIERNGWLRFYKQSAVDALRYNDSTNNKLVDLENGMYGVAWIYMVHDNSCHVVYGQGAYTSEEAKQAALPSPLPGILAAYSTLVGKMTFSRGATTFENAESPFIEKFISSGVSLHNDLAGLDGGNSTQNRYYHLDEPAYNLVNTFADVVDVSPEGDLAIVGDYSGANALFSGNLTVGGTTSGITKAMVGLANAENTADNVKNVLSATKLTTARLIAGVSFDGSANINIPFANISTKPTTISGYGITDAYTKTEVGTLTEFTTNLG